jgi:hypothetical protein
MLYNQLDFKKVYKWLKKADKQLAKIILDLEYSLIPSRNSN